MRKYTIHFLIITLVTLVLGYTGLTFPGESAVRLICLLGGIALMLSCLDAVLISRKMKREYKKQLQKERLQE